MIPIVKGGKVTGYIDVYERNAKMVDKKGYKVADVPDAFADLLDECNNALIECAAESDDDLLEKYFGGEELTRAEIALGLRKGVMEGRIIPVVAGAAVDCALADVLLNQIIALMPSPLDQPPVKAKDMKSGETVEVVCDAGKPFVAQVIKTVADPFVGKLSILRVYQGTLSGGTTVQNTISDKTEKISSIYTMRGKKAGRS